MKASVLYIIFSAAIICVIQPGSNAQSRSIDSLTKLLKTNLHDTIRARLHLLLTRKWFGYDVAESERQLDSGYQFLQKSPNPYNEALYFLRKTELLFEQAKYDEAIISLDTAMIRYNALIADPGNADDKRTIYVLDRGDCYIMKGLLAAKEYRYHQSIEAYLEGISSLEGIDRRRKRSHMATLYADIASNYFELEQFEESLRYDKHAIGYLDSSVNIDLYVFGHLFVADDFNSLSRFDSSEVYLRKVRPIVERLRKPSIDVRFFQTLGGIHRKKKAWQLALNSFERAYTAAEKLKDPFQAVSAAEGVAASYLQLGDINRSRERALYILEQSRVLNVPLAKVQALQLLSDIEEKAGNIEKAYAYKTRLMEASDSLKKEKLQRQMNETESRYENVKKEKEILELQKTNAIHLLSLQRKSTFNYFLIGSVVVLLVTGFLGYRNFRHRQQLARQQDELHLQRIRELEKDKQLIAVDAMLKGQEEERSRLAKDLHDGLGGLLSGVKFSLSNMKDNLIMTPDNMAVFERSLDMLDTSIKELRRVAHNMMPEILTRFGLDEALKEVCHSINATGLLQVNYQSLGMESRLDPGAEIIIYRIVQELLNNVLKHASASSAFVQVIREKARLSVVVEDNGQGFDTSLPGNNKGAGLANIRSRVEYLKGQMDIHSEPGKGTLVNMEFNA